MHGRQETHIDMGSVFNLTLYRPSTAEEEQVHRLKKTLSQDERDHFYSSKVRVAKVCDICCPIQRSTTDCRFPQPFIIGC